MSPKMLKKVFASFVVNDSSPILPAGVHTSVAPAVCKALDSANLLSSAVLFNVANETFPLIFSHIRHIVGAWAYSKFLNKRGTLLAAKRYQKSECFGSRGCFEDGAFLHGALWVAVGMDLNSYDNGEPLSAVKSVYGRVDSGGSLWHSIGHGIGGWAIGYIDLCTPAPMVDQERLLSAGWTVVRLCIDMYNMSNSPYLSNCLQGGFMSIFETQLTSRGGSVVSPCDEIGCTLRDSLAARIVHTARRACWIRFLAHRDKRSGQNHLYQAMYQYVYNSSTSWPKLRCENAQIDGEAPARLRAVHVFVAVTQITFLAFVQVVNMHISSTLSMTDMEILL